MRQKKTDDPVLMEKAVSSRNLTSRADSNRQFAKNDFNVWTAALLNKLDFTSVLDVCCGTGNQLVLYAGKPGVGHIAGVDVSNNALNTAGSRLDSINTSARITLKAALMEDMFEDDELKASRFDLISCFYGLYYSSDPALTLNEMLGHLTDKGAVIIVGPYGNNNAAFFKVLERHFSLPELVTRSSATFMEKEIYPLLKDKFQVEEYNFVNPICYPDARSLIKYWKSSTFYFARHEKAVVDDIETHFSRNNEFIVEKHVKAYIGRKAK